MTFQNFEVSFLFLVFSLPHCTGDLQTSDFGNVLKLWKSSGNVCVFIGCLCYFYI